MPAPPSQQYDLFNNLFKQCYAPIRAYIARRVEAGAVEDIAQKVFARAWRQFNRGSEIRFPQRYLYRSAHNAVVDHYRQRQRQQHVTLDDVSESAFSRQPEQGEAVDKTLDRERLQQQLPSLPPAQREVARQRFLEEKSVGEISCSMGKSPNAISVLTTRAKRRLRA